MECALGIEAAHTGFDVQNGRSIDGVQTLHPKPKTIDRDQTRAGHTNLVWPVFTPLSKDAYLRPSRVVTGVASSGHDFGGAHFVHVEDDFHVRERVQP